MDQMQGDILDVKNGIIVHQVNCRRVMGAGLARKIRQKYLAHYQDYMNTSPALGQVCCTKINDSLYVVGVYGQDRYGRGGCYTDYHALRIGLNTVNDMSLQLGMRVYLPYGIGCGLAGGDWNIVLDIIEEVIPNAIIVRKED